MNELFKKEAIEAICEEMNNFFYLSNNAYNLEELRKLGLKGFKEKYDEIDENILPIFDFICEDDRRYKIEEIRSFFEYLSKEYSFSSKNNKTIIRDYIYDECWG